MSTLHVIVGPMFAGKTEELQRLYRRAVAAKLRTKAYIPVRDSRSAGRIVSHAGIALNATPVSTGEDMLIDLGPTKSVDAVFIDEGQFFDLEFPAAVYHVVNVLGISVVVAGLLRDYRGATFGVMDDVLTQADTMDARQAVCAGCGLPASFSHRLVPSGDRLQVGAQDAYEARCRPCWLKVVQAPWRPE